MGFCTIVHASSCKCPMTWFQSLFGLEIFSPLYLLHSEPQRRMRTMSDISNMESAIVEEFLKIIRFVRRELGIIAWTAWPPSPFTFLRYRLDKLIFHGKSPLLSKHACLLYNKFQFQWDISPLICGKLLHARSYVQYTLTGWHHPFFADPGSFNW